MRRSGTASVRPLRVLLVEDSENDAMLLLRELRRGGYDPRFERVDTPEEMERTLSEALERDEAFEVVISDYYMPRFRAPDALALLRRLGYDVPFIVVSGKVGEDAAVGIMKAGADDYLTKENMSRLCPAIERELREAEARRERERTEAALARSENRFRTLVEQAADAMFVHDREGNLVDVNRRACESLGYTEEELLSMSISEIELDYPPEALKALWEEIVSGPPRTLDGTHLRKDGTTFPVEVRVGVLEAAEGRPPLMLSLARDVTERKEAERKIEETEVLYRTLVEQIPAVTYVQDPNSKHVRYVSPQIESVLGYPPDREILDQDHWINIMHPDDRARAIEEDRRTDETGEPFKVEYRQFAADGRMAWIRDEAVLVHDEGGEPLFWQGIQYDVTEQKRTEEDLRESEGRLQAILDNTPAVVYVKDTEGRFTLVNRRFEEVFHLPKEKVLGRTDHDLFPKEAADEFQANDEEVLRSGIAVEAEEEVPQGAGVRTYFSVKFPLRGPDGVPYAICGISTDITARKRSEEALREAESRYRTLVERIPAVVYVDAVDEEGSTTYMSPQIEGLLGYPARDYVSNPGHWKTLIHPEDRDRVLWEHDRATATGEPFSMEYRFVARDGRVVWVRDEAALMRDGSGRPLFWQGIQTDITGRKSAEEALQISERRFRTIIEQSPLSIQIFSPEGQTLQVNRAWEELWGVTLDDIVGYNILEDRQLVEKGIMPYIRRGFAGERTLIPPILYDPEETIPDLSSNAESGRWVRAFIYPVEEEAGGIREVILMHEDITERKRAEEALRQSEENFRATFEQAAVGMAQVALDGRWFRVNQKLCEIVGYTAEELRGLTFQDITHPDDLGSDLEHVGRLLAGEIETYSMEKRYFRKDGFIVWINLTASLVRESSGDPRYFVGVIEDITERKRTKEALDQSEELYRTVVEQAAESIFLVDAETGRVLESNAALQTSLGYTASKLKRMTLYDLVAHDRESVDCDIERIMQEGRRSLGERQYRRRDGALADVEVNVSALPYDGRRVICILAHDVTERKQAERTLEEIREAERNRIARELHDSTLQDIVYALQEIQIVQVTSGNGGDPALEDAAEALRRSVEGLRDAIFELRLEDAIGRSLVASLRNLVDLNRRMARERYELELVVEDEFPSSVSGRTGQELTRIVQEALTNVRRHAEAGHARVRLGVEGGLAYVEVSDDGRGFDTGSPRIGVGQHSMQGRALELGGELEVESEPGRGTRVRFQIPISRLVQG
ncbi:MAG: PAS domain S-box protein [Actinomycetota bacterium]|nr:PAS domain S-box protein [Actinomycetota bacterium]